MERISERSRRRYGDRLYSDGCLRESEHRFLEFCRAREESIVDSRLRTIHCPILTVDGGMEITENCRIILNYFNNLVGGNP